MIVIMKMIAVNVMKIMPRLKPINELYEMMGRYRDHGQFDTES